MERRNVIKAEQHLLLGMVAGCPTEGRGPAGLRYESDSGWGAAS